jgi:hypothetical protein
MKDVIILKFQFTSNVMLLVQEEAYLPNFWNQKEKNKK